MDIYTQAAEKIINEQRIIIGPIAIEQAREVHGIELDDQNHVIDVKGDKTKILDQLVAQYRKLFGQTSVEVCKEAASALFAQLPVDQIPSLLR